MKTEAFENDPEFEDGLDSIDAGDVPEGGIEAGLDDGPEDEEEAGDAQEGGEGEIDGGEELYCGRATWLNYWRSLLLGAAPVVAGVVLWERNGWILFGGLLFALAVYSCICVHRSMSLYVVTQRRVEIIFGLITKNSNEVRVRDIRAINVRKSGFKGLIGVGTVEFSSAGGGGVEVAFKDVWKPQRVKKLVRGLQDEAG